MMPPFDNPLDLTPVAALATALLAFLLYVLVVFVPVTAGLYLIYFLLTLPMRRTERARLFLDLLELGLKQGRAPEVAIAGAASSGDRSLGRRFHHLAAHLNQGMQLSQALERVPRLLPPQLTAMLKAGERIGDLAQVLPACRRLLHDSVSQVRGALNYVVLVTGVITPFSLVIPLLLRVKVLPAFQQVFEGMVEGAQLPALTRFIFGASPAITGIQAALICVLWLAVLGYVGGPWIRAWLRGVTPNLTDSLLWRLPWRRKRLQRDFSAMLAVLLDAGVPEGEAVTLAGEATANRTLAGRAARVCALLKGGTSLPEAIRALDDSSELRWRLSNALRRAGGFLPALTGWHEALDAKAFQLEQTAAQLTTTMFVLANGLIVAGIVIGMFLVLIQLINRAVLW
jgi:type IV pilus assembly protein PilC